MPAVNASRPLGDKRIEDATGEKRLEDLGTRD